MTAKQFVTRLAWINLPFLILIGGLNYWIDGASTHHLPGERSFFPRTTAHSSLSKLHYLSLEKPETIYFGSSRVEVGLPANPDWVGGGQVYNAGLSGASLGQWGKVLKYVLALMEPKKVVVGLEFTSFTIKDGSSDLDFSLVSSNAIIYFIKRLPLDLAQSLTFKATQDSVKAITASFKGGTYDDEPLSQSGQLTEASMKRSSAKAATFEFNKRIKQIFSPPSQEHIANKASWLIFDELLAQMCQKKIVTRVYIHPTHAVTFYSLLKNGKWSEFEQWKTDLANLATHYQNQQCDLKIVDFSGYNSITTESIMDWTPNKDLKYYWEVSHYKSNVGNLILKRLFSLSSPEVPHDFGRDLNKDTVAGVLTAIREEQDRYLATHAEEIKFAQTIAKATNIGIHDNP